MPEEPKEPELTAEQKKQLRLEMDEWMKELEQKIKSRKPS